MGKVICFILAFSVLAIVISCSEQNTVDPIEVEGGTQSIQDPLIQKVDALLNKEIATDSDAKFIMSLTEAEIERIIVYYEAHPKIVAPVESEPSIDPDLITSYIQESIECRDGYGGRVASSWMHTTACGGDGSDHFYFYSGVPNAYRDHGYLQGRSIHPAVLMALASYGWKLDARVYENGNVYICVGVRIHYLGLTHEAWRSSFYLYKTN